MQRKKLILRLALLAIVVAAAAGSVNMFEIEYTNSMERRLLARRDNHIAELTKECQKFLDEAAAKINGPTLNPHLVSQIKSEIFKKRPNTTLYLWMSDSEGKFIFGVPSPVFSRLNKTYDKYQSAIEKDGYFLDRNDFLLKMVDRGEGTYISGFETGGRSLVTINNRRYYLRDLLFRDDSRKVFLTLSSPVVDQEERMVGELYLKVDDDTFKKDYYRYRGENFLNTILFPAFHFILGVSLVLLWMLLPSWVYIDARQRDVKRAGMWALLTVISFGFAWLVYLITRPGTLKSFHCPQCEQELNGSKAFCPHCGFDLSGAFCPQCQYPIRSEWQFCPACRCDLSQEPKEEQEQKKQKETKS